MLPQVLGFFASLLLSAMVLSVAFSIQSLPRVTSAMILASLLIVFSQVINLGEEFTALERVPIIGSQGLFYMAVTDQV
ncbi:hypothetical protein IIC65_03070, partial [Candidatus Sumerlaeota bacterium]|nr:hypothetical protein [Candidatus Sumerlaeota bacterium]